MSNEISKRHVKLLDNFLAVTEEDRAFIENIVDKGMKKTSAAKDAYGVTDKLTKFANAKMVNPRIRAAMEEYRSAKAESFLDKMLSASDRALDKTEDLMNCGDVKTELGAAKEILANARYVIGERKKDERNASSGNITIVFGNGETDIKKVMQEKKVNIIEAEYEIEED